MAYLITHRRIQLCAAGLLLLLVSQVHLLLRAQRTADSLVIVTHLPPHLYDAASWTRAAARD